MTTSRRVVVSAEFVDKAKSLYPPGGSSEGRPSYEMFCSHALPVAKTAFSRAWDKLPFDGIPALRYLVAAVPPFFGAIIFYCVDVGDHVELVDVDEDPDYWGFVADDDLF